MSATKASIQFIGFQVKESYISFNEISEYKIKIDFDASGKVEKSINKFFLSLKAIVSEEQGKFNITINSESIFNFDEEILEDEVSKTLFSKNAPAIVFPYIRAYIASLTALSGMPTLNLPTLNLTQIGESLSKSIVVEE